MRKSEKPGLADELEVREIAPREHPKMDNVIKRAVAALGKPRKPRYGAKSYPL